MKRTHIMEHKVLTVGIGLLAMVLPVWSAWLGSVSAAEDKTGATAPPPLSTQEFATAKQLYFALCAECHGVLRNGAVGKPLTTDLARHLGTGYLTQRITHGSPAGMPAWGDSGQLGSDQINIMARYLQYPVPAPYMAEMLDLARTRQ
ncbi:MAG: cytochrome c [Magnetococcales bacterium]|nr:cytochrome c [Magnetococcales bacterium]